MHTQLEDVLLTFIVRSADFLWFMADEDHFVRDRVLSQAECRASLSLYVHLLTAGIPLIFLNYVLGDTNFMKTPPE